MAAASKAAFAAAIARLESVGGQRVEVDFSPFAEAAALLYQSSFVAERYSGIRAFLDKPAGGSSQQPEDALRQQRTLNGDQRLLPVTRAIISGAGESGGIDMVMCVQTESTHPYSKSVERAGEVKVLTLCQEL
jgi:allophanate hydrolase